MDKTFYLNSTFEKKVETNKGLRIAGYANTVSKDRSGDVVTAEAWAKGVENFRKNPIMLYQHKHDCPIGRFEKLIVDKKGIFVEGLVSEAAEKTLGIHTLIKDGSLKSFSVGFRVKDADYDRSDDSMTITEVELLEISVVSVPCNQESLFSVRKSFESDNEYKEFIKSITDEKDVLEEVVEEAIAVDEPIEEKTFTTDVTTETAIIADNVNLTADIFTDDFVEKIYNMIDDVIDAKAASDAEAKIDYINNLNSESNDYDTAEANAPIDFINMLSVDAETLKVDDNVEYKGEYYKIVDTPSEQNPLFKFLRFDLAGDSCNNTINVSLEELSQTKNTKEKIVSEEIGKDTTVDTPLHGDSTKENDQMAEQVVDTIDLSKNIKVEAKKDVAPAATVSEPRFADLVEKTGEAMLREMDAKDKHGDYTPIATEEVAELKSLVSKYKDEISALQHSKMLYNENNRSNSQFSEKDMADAVLLSKILNKRDVYDTNFGSRMKAVTSVTQLLSTFSTNIYKEMEQQLIIAPMFKRMPVTSKSFHVPVADEDTDGDVAMFRSGTYATGVGDTTNVPVSNQNTISSVEFTPHKFMATTHLAKDEEEDTIIPLLGFLREGTTRRLARAIDKSILRGTGALTGFTASPTNAITAGTGYASVIEGITNLTSDASLEVATGSGTDKADPSDIAAARAAMGKYGLQLGSDLVFVTSIEGYNNLVTTSDFRTVDKFGDQATYLTGSVGAVYGIPIVISEFLDSATTTGNHLGVLMYKPGFMIAERRGIEIESEYEARQQVTAMYLSTRFDFHALTTNSNAALDATKYAYAVTVAAG